MQHSRFSASSVPFSDEEPRIRSTPIVRSPAIPILPRGSRNGISDPNLGFLMEGDDVVITSAQARYLIDNCVHPVQGSIRPLTDKAAVDHMDVVRALMTTPGAWRKNDQIHIGVINGRAYILNGNHRMGAQAACDVSISWNVQIWHLPSDEAFRAEFHKFDTNSRARTDAQIVSGTGYAAKLGIAKQVGTAVFNAVPSIIGEFRTGKLHIDYVKTRVVDTRLSVMHEYRDEAVLFDECLRHSNTFVRRKLLAGGVTAVALVTLKHQPEKAIPFWTGVAGNSGLVKKDPRHTLVQALLTRGMNRGAAHQSIAVPASAWNAWYKGRELSLIKINEDAEVVAILGTPYR